MAKKKCRKRIDKKSISDPKKMIREAVPELVASLLETAKESGTTASINAIKQLFDLSGADQGEEYKIDLMFVPIQRLDDGKYSVIPLADKPPESKPVTGQNEQQA